MTREMLDREGVLLRNALNRFLMQIGISEGLTFFVGWTPPMGCNKDRACCSIVAYVEGPALPV
jgi:hypothetical protein